MNKFRFSIVFQAIFVLFISTSIVSCVEPQGTYKNIQFCLTKEKDVKYLKDLLRTIAINENLDYLDGSERLYDFLSNSADPVTKRPTDTIRRDKFIHLSVVTPDETLGLSVANYDDRDNQVILSAGALDAKLAIPFANKVEEILQKDWKLHVTTSDEPNYALKCSE